MKVTGINLLTGSHTSTELPGTRSLSELLVKGTDLTAVRIPEASY